MVILWLACNDDDSCPTEPEPTEADWLIYHGYDADSFNYYIPIYSTRELQAVDTLVLGSSTEVNDMQFTSDGRFSISAETKKVGFEVERYLVVRDVNTGDTVSVVSLIFATSDDLLLSADDQYAMVVSPVRGLTVYTIPDLAVAWSAPSRIVVDVAFLVPSNEIVYCLENSDTLYRVDFINNPDSVVRTRIPTDWPSYAPGVVPCNLVAHHSTEQLYAIAINELDRRTLWSFDMSDFTTLDQRRLPEDFYYGRPLVSATGRQVFLSALHEETGERGILKYLPEHNTLTMFFNSSDIIYPEFIPYDWVLTPDEELLCVLVDRTGLGTGEVILFDANSASVLHVFDPDFGWGRPRFVRVNPNGQ
jgi:hypothetical protein